METSNKAMHSKGTLSLSFFKKKKSENTKVLSEENKLFVENSRRNAALTFSKKI